MRSMLVVMLGVFWLAVSGVANAQSDTTVRFTPYSERYSIDIPSGWVASADGIRGLSGTFVDETIAIADSDDSMRSLQSNNPSVAIAGKTLVADVFPVVSITGGQPYDSAEDLFRMLLQEQADDATLFSINGLAAVRVDDYPGSPYNANPLAGMTLVLDGNLIYYMVYAGPDQAALDELAAIATTLIVHPVDTAHLAVAETLGQNRQLLANHLQIPMNDGWMVLSGGPAAPGEVSYFMILANPSALDYLLAPTGETTLPGMLIQVQVVPYVAMFGTTDYTPTDDDLSMLMLQTLNSTGGDPQLGAQELTISGASAQRVEITNALGGDNRGAILMIDSGDTFYTLTTVGPAGEWEAVYQPLVDALFSRVELVTPDPNQITVGLQVGQYAPDFALTTLDGQSIQLSQLRGQTVILNFWATWCPPCRAEMPEFQTVYSNQSDEFVIVAVNLMEDTDLVQDFVTEFGLSFPIGLDPDGTVNSLYAITGYPSSYVVDSDGIIRVVHVGPTTAAQVQQWLEIAK